MVIDCEYDMDLKYAKTILLSLQLVSQNVHILTLGWH